jgi:LPXTG-motif cell wall-anchored protein
MKYATPLGRLAYVAVILLATLTGLEAELDAERIRRRLALAFDTDVRPADVVDAVRNIALFAGWGAVWIVTGPATHLLRRIAGATLTGAALSIFVEIVQLTSIRRTSSILDVATNSAGALAGAAVVALAILLLRRRREARSFIGMPAAVFAAGYGAAVALEMFIPLFQPETLPGASGAFMSRLRHAMEQFEPASLLEMPLLNLLLLPAAGAFAVAALAESGWSYRRAWPLVAGVGALLAASLEILAGGAGHPIIAGAVPINALALAGGAAAAAHWLPGLTTRLRGRQRPLALLAAYAALLCLWAWRPFTPDLSADAFMQQLTLERLTPLAAHGQSFNIISVVDVLRQFALLAPVGALLAVWPLRHRGWLAGPLPGVYAAALLEAGQLFITGRLFDVTDLIIGGAGALIGWVIVRRSGFGVHGAMLPDQRATRRPTRPRRPDRDDVSTY